MQTSKTECETCIGLFQAEYIDTYEVLFKIALEIKIVRIEITFKSPFYFVTRKKEEIFLSQKYPNYFLAYHLSILRLYFKIFS